MFTGIIEKTVAVAGVVDLVGSRQIKLPRPWPDLQPGQSIAVNGCCLTIARLSPETVEFDVIAETLAKTNLGLLKAGSEVQLERSLRIGDRLDGHMVQGHVDAVAPLLARKSDEKECRLTLQIPPAVKSYIIPKGSVSLDGVSLTIAAVNADSFEVALIPTTLNITALGRRPMGYAYNVEADLLAKTIVFWLEHQPILRQSVDGAA
jgi:riboflavin synthase